MEKLDKSRFRFKIGDTVLYNGEPYKILAYYFLNDFNNFNDPYGYTLKVEVGHSGSNSSYNELGEKQKFEKGTCWWVNEDEVEKYCNPLINDFSKAKPGDKVRVKPFDKEKSYQFGINNDMILLEGKIFTIKSITEYKTDLSKDYPANYLINLVGKDWLWSDAMLELLTEDKSCDTKESSISKTIKKVKNIFKEDIDIEIIVKKKKPKLTFNL